MKIERLCKELEIKQFQIATLKTPRYIPVVVNVRFEIMKNTIAEIGLIGVWPNGYKKPIVVQIGKPYKNGSQFKCPVSLKGLYDNLSDMSTDDSFSSLCMAMALTRRLLLDFQEKGGKLFFEGEDDEFNSETEINIADIWDMHGPSALKNKSNQSSDPT